MTARAREMEVKRLISIITDEFRNQSPDLDTIKACVRATACVSYAYGGRAFSAEELTDVVMRVYVNLSRFNPLTGSEI